MPDIAPESVPVVELTDSDRAGQTLLIITASSATAPPSSAGLRLRFDRSRVVQVGSVGEVESLAVELKADSYDTVVIDGPAVGPAVRNALAGLVGESLRPGGRIVVVMDPEPGWSPAPGAPGDLPPDLLDGSHRSAPAPAPSLAGLTWEGVATLGGAPCALLARRADETGAADAAPATADVAARLATMEQTLAARRPYDSATPRGRGSGPHGALHESEAALLAHLRTAVQEQAREQKRREQEERRREDVEKRYTSLERQHARLRKSKLGVAMARYWQVKKRVRRMLGG